MKRKPWSLVILALLHVLAPVGSFVLNALYMGRNFSEQWHFWFELTPKILLACYVGLPVLAGVFIFLCRRWSYWLYLLCLSCIFAANIFGYWTHLNWSAFFILLLVLSADILVVAYFVVPSVQTLYLDSRHRWWESAPRYRVDFLGSVNGVEASLKNIAQGGLYLVGGPELQNGDKAEIHFKYLDMDIKVVGEVVYRSPGSENIGYGIRFDPGLESMALIKKLISELHKQGKIVTERLPGPEDSFGYWLKRLITTGEGLFPKFR